MLTAQERIMTSVVEPLCKATAGLFEPIEMADRDWLELDIDDEAKRLVAEVRAYAPAEAGKCRYCDHQQDSHPKGAGYHPFTPAPTYKFNGGEWAPHPIGPTQNARTTWLHRIAERKDLKNGKWQLAGTDFTVLVIAHTWRADRIRFLSEHAKLMYDYLLKRFLAQNKAALIAAEYKVNKTIPALPSDFIEHPDNPLLGFQRVPTAMFLHQEGALLFMEQGTGKTPTTINRIMLESGRKYMGKTPGVTKGMYRVLIVCPNQVRFNWTSEFERFATLPGKAVILRGDGLGRVRLLVDAVRPEPDCAWSAAIIGVDSVHASLDHLCEVPWDLVVLDEAHYICNHRSKRWQAMIALRDSPNVRQRMALTGTPIKNTPMDLWAILEFIGEGMSGFMSFKNFREFYGKYIKGIGGQGIEKLIGLRNVPLLQERLARMCFLIKKDEAGLELPDKVYDVIEVEMTPSQAEMYRKVRDQLALEIKAEQEQEGKRLRADHVLTKLLRLAQITSGFVKWDDVTDPDTGNVTRIGHTEAIPGGNPKLDAVIEGLMAEDRDPKGKTIIWSCFRASLTLIGERLEAEGIKYVEYWGDTSENDRKAAVHNFNSDPSIKVFLANPATAGAGLNLLGYDPSEPDLFDTYCDWEIVFDQGWSSVLRSQAEDRAHRKGTRSNVRITDLTVPGTIDEEIRKRVTAKIDMANKIQDVAEILRNVLNLAGV